MYADMEQWNDIRRRVLVEGVSKRSILRETGMHWRTLNKIPTLFQNFRLPFLPSRDHLTIR